MLRRAAGRFLLIGLAVAGLHVAAMISLEDLSPREAVWLTMTTLVTVGYGDYAAKTPLGQTATVLLLYLAGVFLAAQAASAWFDYLSARREAMRNGKWDWSGVRDHILFVAPGKVGEMFLLRLLSEMEEHVGLRGRDLVIVSDEFPEGLPGAVGASHAKLVTGQAQDPETLQRAAVEAAAYVMLIADDPENRVSDGIAFDILTRVREENSRAVVIVECVDDRNRARLKAGGANVVIRPIRAYPEMTVTALTNPGSSEIIENLVSAVGERIVLVTGAFSGRWKSLVLDMLERGDGLPVAARLKDGAIVTAPQPERELDADARYVLKSSAAPGG